MRDIQAQIGMQRPRNLCIIAWLQAMGSIEKKARLTDARLTDIVIAVQGRCLFEGAAPLVGANQSELMPQPGDDPGKTLKAFGRPLPSQKGCVD